MTVFPQQRRFVSVDRRGACSVPAEAPTEAISPPLVQIPIELPPGFCIRRLEAAEPVVKPDRKPPSARRSGSLPPAFCEGD
jgi:hypothetical protein